MLVTVRLPNNKTYTKKIKSDNQLEAAANAVKDGGMFGKIPHFSFTSI